MWFIIHLTTVVVALLFICGTEAKPQDNLFADTDWSDISKGCIRNNNYKVVGRPTMDSCKEMCVNEDGINCQSIEYNPDHKICGISEARIDSEHFMETCYEDGWEYTERIQAAGGESCSDNDRTCRILAEEGECQKHTSFMKNNCKKSCNYCPSDWCTSLSPPGFWIPTGTRTSEPCRIGTHSVTPPTPGEMRLGAQCCQPVSNILVRDWCTSLSPPGFWIVAGTRTSKPCPVGTHSVSGEIRLGAQCCQPVGTKDLCSEMKGTCVNPKRLGCTPYAAMKIYNVSFPNITEKYCGNSVPESPACCAPSGQVFTVDIENGLAFIFNNTLIYNNWEPQGETTRWLVDYTESTVRKNLIGFLGILNKYLKAPDHIHDHTKTFIQNVTEYVLGQESFTAPQLQNIFIELQSNGGDGYLSAWQPSVSCHNIKEDKCYANEWIASCGFWNMFHTMTVSAAKDNATDHLEVLEAIKGFMHNFFFCWECRHHFLGMYEQTIDTYGDNTVNTTDKAILWLWCTHNTVNQVWPLEEGNYWPPHPRFPPPGACPDCWTESPGAEYTNCSALFCQGNQGPYDCFEAQSVLHKPPFPRTYHNFSMPHVLQYLKGVYSGPYSILNPQPIDKKLNITANIKCPQLQ